MTTAAAAGSSSFCDTEINILFLNPLALGTAPQWLGWLLLNYPTQSLKGPAKASAQVFPWIIEQL
ncbi:MAG TPA: hypothetical protein VFU22_29335, partial [Roseiflexaceae bacterium]|nr:hypothetical protein [Roseiflexaceae bacterium]